MGSSSSDSSNSSSTSSCQISTELKIWSRGAPPTTVDVKNKAIQMVCSDELAIVSIHSRRISYPLAVHHFIVATIEEDNLFRVYEWGTLSGCSSEKEIYAAKSIQGGKCVKNLGERTLSEVYEAAQTVSQGKKYNFMTFNCNDWTEEVCKKLRFNLKVKSFCNCRKKIRND